MYVIGKPSGLLWWEKLCEDEHFLSDMCISVLVLWCIYYCPNIQGDFSLR